MMGQGCLTHEEPDGVQYIISVVETLHCYHAANGSIACAIPRTEKSVERKLDRPFVKLSQPARIVAKKAINGL